MIDPFAAPEEAQQTIQHEQPPTQTVGTVSVDVKPRILSPELADATITTTYKGGSGFDAPWIVTRANSTKEADALLDDEFKAYMSKVKRVAEFFAGGSLAPARGGNTAAASAAPQGATQAPAWAPPKPFDDFVYKTGVSAKNGKTWHAWMPPQQGDSRQAKFFYPN